MTSPSAQLGVTTPRDERLAREWLDRAEEHRSAGRLIDAVDALTLANRASPSTETERSLVRARHDGFAELARNLQQLAPPIPPGDPLPSASSLPIVSARELTPELISTGIRRHGALHVRGLMPEQHVAAFADGIDRAMAAGEAFDRGATAEDTTPWFEPFKPNESYSVEMKLQVGNRRRWVREAGGVWTADSPRMMFEFFEALEAVGLRRTITDYLGERPVLAVDKCTLRRVGLDTGADWHQDGAFLGTGPSMRTVNVWMSLSHCGTDAPGLDVVPARLESIVPTGTDGAQFEWAVGPGAVDRVVAFKGLSVFRPVFEPGDALIFDELFLHRTAIDGAMTNVRYAIETWFFAPSLYPEKYVPVIV
jgi:Phytanoyl-CoA dioxygenase (PhyH)